MVDAISVEDSHCSFLQRRPNREFYPFCKKLVLRVLHEPRLVIDRVYRDPTASSQRTRRKRRGKDLSLEFGTLEFAEILLADFEERYSAANANE